MTTPDAQNVRVAITGGVYRAPLGTALPTGPTGSLNAAFVNLGYIGEDGVTEAHEDSIDNIVAWQNAQVVRAARTESLATLQFMMIESNVNTLETFHPGSVMTEPSPGVYKLEVKPPTAGAQAWVLDVVDGSIHQRIAVGNGEVTERGEVQYVNGQPIGYPVTITCYPDDDGNLMVKWSDDIAWAPAS